LRYFKNQLRALAKQLTWHDTLVLLDVELIQKLGWDNVVPNTHSRKEEFQIEKLLTKTQALKAIFQGESDLERKIKEANVQDLLV
jgi:hypothetical protein